MNTVLTLERTRGLHNVDDGNIVVYFFLFGVLVSYGFLYSYPRILIHAPTRLLTPRCTDYCAVNVKGAFVAIVRELCPECMRIELFTCPIR